MAGEGEAAKDGAIPANGHFPQTGDRQDAECAHPGPKRPDRAETRHRWRHHHERRSARCSQLHVRCQDSRSLEESMFKSALILPNHFIVVNNCNWQVKACTDNVLESVLLLRD